LYVLNSFLLLLIHQIIDLLFNMNHNYSKDFGLKIKTF